MKKGKLSLVGIGNALTRTEMKNLLGGSGTVFGCVCSTYPFKSWFGIYGEMGDIANSIYNNCGSGGGSCQSSNR